MTGLTSGTTPFGAAKSISCCSGGVGGGGRRIKRHIIITAVSLIHERARSVNLRCHSVPRSQQLDVVVSHRPVAGLTCSVLLRPKRTGDLNPIIVDNKRSFLFFTHFFPLSSHRFASEYNNIVSCRRLSRPTHTTISARRHHG